MKIMLGDQEVGLGTYVTNETGLIISSVQEMLETQKAELQAMLDAHTEEVEGLIDAQSTSLNSKIDAQTEELSASSGGDVYMCAGEMFVKTILAGSKSSSSDSSIYTACSFTANQTGTVKLKFYASYSGAPNNYWGSVYLNGNTLHSIDTSTYEEFEYDINVEKGTQYVIGLKVGRDSYAAYIKNVRVYYALTNIDPSGCIS